MLKIKDNVDLKELEKYGFEYNEAKKECFYRIDNSEVLTITINSTSIIHKTIRLYIDDEYCCCWGGKYTFDLLYDLIKDGLVEKVD